MGRDIRGEAAGGEEGVSDDGGGPVVDGVKAEDDEAVEEGEYPDVEGGKGGEEAGVMRGGVAEVVFVEEGLEAGKEEAAAEAVSAASRVASAVTEASGAAASTLATVVRPVEKVIERIVQLRINILPFAHPQVGKKPLLAEFASLALRAEPVPFVMDRVPNIKQGEKIRLRIGKLLVRRSRGVLLVQRPFTRILDA